MPQYQQSTRNFSQRAVRASASVLAAFGLVLSATAASSNASERMAEAKIKVEAERTSLGAKIVVQGQGFTAAARVKVSATRAPGASGTQEFGMVSADADGKFQLRKTVGCTSDRTSDAAEKVTFTAADSATGAAVTAVVTGGAWICQ